MSWSESGKNWLESTKILNPFEMNWFEGTKNMNLSERAKTLYECCKNMNLCERAKNGFGKNKSWVEDEVRDKGISDEHRDLLIKDVGALLLSLAIGYKDGFGSSSRFILTRAANSDDCSQMAKDELEKSKNWVEEEIRTKGSISVEHLDLLIKAGVLLLAPAIGYYVGFGNACVFILKYAASDDGCREMAFEKSKSWVEMVKNGFEKSKNWAEEKIRATGISDEHRDFVVKGGGALLLTAAKEYYGGLGGACRFIFRGRGSDDGEKLMKAPGRPGEYIARAAFEANAKAYFRGLRGKHP